MVVDSVEGHRDAVRRKAEGDHHVAACGGCGEDLSGETEDRGPEDALDGELPLALVARFDARGVGAEDEGDAFAARGEVGDPEGGANVADVRDDGVEFTLADEFPEAGVAPGPETFCAIPLIGNVRPFVAVEKRDVPLAVGADLGVVAVFGATQAAISYLIIELGVAGHEAKERGAVLNRV